MKFDGDTVALDVLLLVGITVTFVILSRAVSSTTVKLSLSPASEVVRVGLEIVISAESLYSLLKAKGDKERMQALYYAVEKLIRNEISDDDLISI